MLCYLNLEENKQPESSRQSEDMVRNSVVPEVC